MTHSEGFFNLLKHSFKTLTKLLLLSVPLNELQSVGF